MFKFKFGKWLVLGDKKQSLVCCDENNEVKIFGVSPNYKKLSIVFYIYNPKYEANFYFRELRSYHFYFSDFRSFQRAIRNLKKYGLKILRG